jgi:DNA-binding transcriptional LysR family regulator
MEPRAVRHFLAAYDSGSFAAAADRLNLSPQAVSKSVLRLETELGIKLFERDGRRIRPTAYAELYLPHARTIAAETDKFRAELGDLLGGRKGRLRVGAGPSAAADVLARAVLGLAEVRPGLTLQILAGLQATMAEALVLGQLDLFVALRQIDRPHPLIHEETLGQMRYCVVAGAGHPLASARRTGLESLGKSRWVLGANIGAVDSSIDASFSAAGLPLLRPDMETTSVLFTLAILDGGQHLSILPEMLVARDLQSRRLVRLDVDTETWTRPLIVATRVRGPKPVEVMMLIEQLQRAMVGP